MLIRKNRFFDSFRCIAQRCPDSCCKEWDVQVDEESARLYQNLPGALGDELRRVMTQNEDGDTVFTIVNRRCPMWREDSLCRIQAELGHDALCKTCRDYPRLKHDYGDFVEYTLELSCPEAARILLTSPWEDAIVQEIPGGEAPEYDREAMDILLRTRERMYSILSLDLPVETVLTLGYLYAFHAQAQLDGGEETPFDIDSALVFARDMAKAGNESALVDFYKALEILTPNWRNRLANPSSAPWSEPILNLARCGVERYWLQAVSDYDLICRVKMVIASCLLVKTLGGDPVETAQIYAKEIENNADNVDAILDAAYENPAFTDDKLLGLLLGV